MTNLGILNHYLAIDCTHCAVCREKATSTVLLSFRGQRVFTLGACSEHKERIKETIDSAVTALRTNEQVEALKDALATALRKETMKGILLGLFDRKGDK